MKFSSEFQQLINDVDEYMPRNMHAWDGSNDLGVEVNYNHGEKKGLCYFVLRQLAVHWNGDVSPCCIDLNRRGDLGSLKNKSIYEIYHSSERRMMISKMRKNNRKEIELCKKCNL